MAVEAVGVRLRRDSIARAMFVFTLFVRVSGMSKLSDSDFARRSPTWDALAGVRLRPTIFSSRQTARRASASSGTFSGAF